jgi:hypothetical protein
VQTGAVPRSDHRYLASTFFHEADHSSAGTPGCNYGPGSTTTSQPHRAYCLFRHLTRPLPDGLARLPERALTTCIRLARAFAPCGYLTAVPRTLLSFHRVTCLALPTLAVALTPSILVHPPTLLNPWPHQGLSYGQSYVSLTVAERRLHRPGKVLRGLCCCVALGWPPNSSSVALRNSVLEVPDSSMP